MANHVWLGLALACSGIAMTITTTDAKAFKSFQSKECKTDYKRLCPMTPIGKCDLQSMIEQLSPACKAYVEKHR
ncbi:hypothetical protein FJ872_31620 [Mesorhizobium sp. B2-5-9]|nr:hypothetical protein FJ872_31620 [Mesorhizobium sp. B2-5-9]